MPVSAQDKRQSGRRLRSQAQLTEDWRPATDLFSGSPSPKRSDKPSTMKSPVNRKLRRQTMMPRSQGAGGPAAAAAAAITIPDFTPPLSQRRTRRQSMMPVKLRESVLTMSPKKAVSPPLPALNERSKRKLGPDVDAVEKPTASKRSRVIPASKSSSEVKTGPSSSSPEPATKKHKSLISLPMIRISRSTSKIADKPASPKTKKPAEKAKKSPAKKRALSPSPSKPSSPTRKRPAQAQPSPPKRRATSRSRSVPRLERTKSLPRGQKRGAKVPEKPPIPSPKKKATPKKKASSVLLNASSPPARSSPKAKTPKTRSTPALKTPASPRTPKSTKKSTASLKTKAQATPKAETKKSTASLKNKAQTTPKAETKKKPATLPKTPQSDKKIKTPKAQSNKRVPADKTPQIQKTIDVPDTPPSTGEKTRIRTPKIVIRKIKSPVNLASPKVNTPATPSPRRPRLTRSAAKTRITSSSKSTKHVQLQGKSPSSSLATFRKTPSSRKKTTADLYPKDLGASPVLPSAHQQLQRIREAISSAKKTRSTPPRKTQPLTTTASPTKVITKADIHVSGNGKCGLESSLDNHCDSWQSSTPTARAPLPSTPKSARGATTRISQFTNRVNSRSVTVQHHTTSLAAPTSSTPIKGSRKLEVIEGRAPLQGKDTEDLTPSETEADDTVDEGRADASVEESVDLEGGETSLEESVEEEEQEEEEEEEEEDDNKEEKESTTQSSRKSYCSLM